MISYPSPSSLTDADLFGNAQWHAQNARHWRAVAAAGGDDRHTLRQAAYKALRSERRIVDLSITAEKRCAAQVQP